MTKGLCLSSWKHHHHHHHRRLDEEGKEDTTIVGDHLGLDVALCFWQTAPQRIWRRIPKSKRVYVYAGIAALLMFSFFEAALNLVTPSTCPIVNGQRPAKLLECNSQLWQHDSACGPDGRQCWPSEESFAFRCPSQCRYQSTVYDHRMVGNISSLYKPYIIGPSSEGGFYRADSFICAAALHAGVISNTHGGCGVLKWSSEPVFYDDSTTNSGLTSIPFDAVFPVSFKFEPRPISKLLSMHCRDWRHEIIIATILATMGFGYITAQPEAFFWPLFIIGFWCVILVSDPPAIPLADPNPGAYLIMVGWSRFLPAVFVAYAILNVCVRPLLDGLQSQLSKTLLYVPALWGGILMNYTLDRLPIDRFTGDDLNALPGARLTAFLLGVIVIFAAIGQVKLLLSKHHHHTSKSSPHHVLGRYEYFCLMGVLVFLATVPRVLQLRLHHYVIALILLPGTIPRCSMSLIYQGFLVGLFINGVAKWGFASILETPTALARGSSGSLFLDNCNPSSSDTGSRLDLNTNPVHVEIDRGERVLRASWNDPFLVGNSGYSLVINDVERYRGANTSVTLDLSVNSGFWGPWNLLVHSDHINNINELTPWLTRTLYIRLAMVDTLHSVGEYSNPQKIFL